MSLVKSLVGIILLPVLAGLCNSFVVLLISIVPPASPEIWFISGFVLFFLIFIFKPLPGSIYVFGHELTHAVWVLLFRGKVKAFKVTSRNGSVITTKTNFFTCLCS